MHFLKKDQKIRAWVDLPPIIRAMPERKRFFAVDVFPYRAIVLYKEQIKQYILVNVMAHHHTFFQIAPMIREQLILKLVKVIFKEIKLI